MERECGGALTAFALIYVTFFLDNVLLTVLVPIIPDWVRGESLELWAQHEAPLVALLNRTVQRGVGAVSEGVGVGGAQAAVGAVLSAKAAVQLASAPLAAAAVCRRGPAPVLRVATALLALAALAAAAARGARAAGARCTARRRRWRAWRGWRCARPPCPRATTTAPSGRCSAPSRSACWWGIRSAAQRTPRGAAARPSCSSRPRCCSTSGECELVEGAGWSVSRAARVCSAGGVYACAGAVLLTTSVMAALEPSLPLWLARKFGSRRWQAGAAFVPDSAGYLLAASGAGALARRAGAERVALAGQVAVALAALAIPHATSVSWLALPHAALGVGLGAADAALVPALLARHAHDAPTIAALLQAASSAAYALGPVAGGLVSWWAGFETALRALGVLNLLYAAWLYRALSRHPLSEQWGARSPEDEDGEETQQATGEMVPRCYNALQ